MATSATEARALGTMTARMHLSLDRAFLRHHEAVVDWVDGAEAEIAGADPSLLEAPGVADLSSGSASPMRGFRSSARTATSI